MFRKKNFFTVSFTKNDQLSIQYSFPTLDGNMLKKLLISLATGEVGYNLIRELSQKYPEKNIILQEVLLSLQPNIPKGGPIVSPSEAMNRFMNQVKTKNE